MLTLEEIENITFHKSGLGGYKIDEVNSFVDKVIKKVKALENQNRELESRIESLDKTVQEYKEKEDSVQSALVTAQMTAKQIVMEATEKSDKQLSESKEEAERLLNDAKERSEKLNAETDAKIEEKMNTAIRESAEKIEENNRILEAQKKNIIKLMGEANNFRNSLLRAYKNHLSVINSMAKGEDFKKYQKELEDNYPAMKGNKPDPVSSCNIAADEEQSPEENQSDVEVVYSGSETDVTEETNAPQKDEAEDKSNKRQPINISGSGNTDKAVGSGANKNSENDTDKKKN